MAEEREKRQAAIRFCGQLRFCEELVALGGRVAAHPAPAERLPLARRELQKALFSNSRGGFYPFGNASDGLFPVVSLPFKDAYVFNTNERAPLLLVLEGYQLPRKDASPGIDCSRNTDLAEGFSAVHAHIFGAGNSTDFLWEDLENGMPDSMEGASPDAIMTPAQVKEFMSSNPNAHATQSIKETVHILRSKNEGIDRPPDVPSIDEGSANSEAILYAKRMRESNLISEKEYKELVAKDKLFQKNLRDHAHLDVQFWLALSFGETWAAKARRLRRESPHGGRAGWGLRSLLVKTNADLRQEVFTLQLIGLCKQIFEEAGLNLWLSAYQILPTSSTTGFVETLINSISLDALKKHESFISLEQHFVETYAKHTKTIQPLDEARSEYIASLAAYSLVCYLFQIKDRHNGNILLDTAGHLVHIDFGFLLGSAPGGAFSIETAPFKLTEEMVAVLGGPRSRLFADFVCRFTCGFLALQRAHDRVLATVELLAEGASAGGGGGSGGGAAALNFLGPGKTQRDMLERLSQRFRRDLTWVETIQFCLDLIKKSYRNANTKRYDDFQWISQGIKP